MESARAQVVLAAILFSTGGAAIKATSFTGLQGGLQVACLRSAVAAAALALLLPRARHGWSWRTLAVGAAFAATLMLFVTANKLTTSASAIFLQNTAPLYVLLLGPLVLRERTRPLDLLYMAALMTGLGLVIAGPGTPVDTAPQPLLGNVLALASGATWAATVIGLRLLARGEGGADTAAAATLAGNVLAFALCLPLAVPASGDAGDWILIAYLGTFQIAAAYVLLARGMRRVSAFEVTLLLFVEPALNPLWSWLVHGESATALAAAGGAVILGATAAKVGIDRRPGARAAPAGRTS